MAAQRHMVPLSPLATLLASGTGKKQPGNQAGPSEISGHHQ